MAKLAPWGFPPTPILPRWFRELCANTPVPEIVTQAHPTVRFLGDLGAEFWTTYSKPLDKLVLRSVVRSVGSLRPPEGLVIIPRVADPNWVRKLPLRPRTANSLRNGILRNGQSLAEDITVGRLLELRSFGRTSLLDAMCVVEAALATLTEAGVPVAVESQATNGDEALADSRDYAWLAARPHFESLLAGAREFLGARSVADAVRLDLAELVRSLDLEEALRATSIAGLVPSESFCDRIVRELDKILESSSPLERRVLEERAYAAHPRTLKALGEEGGVTRERVRQLQVKTLERVEARVQSEITKLVAIVRPRLGAVVSASTLHQQVANLFPDEARPGTILARKILLSCLAYSADGEVCLSQEAIRIIDDLERAAHERADRVGLVNEAELRATTLPDARWNEHWEALIGRSCLSLVRGHLALRDTAQARVKVAIIELGQVATKEEIAERADVEPSRVGSLLSVIPGVCRADKRRWGLREWIDDVYEGIPAEITQRIEQGGGVASLAHILADLPRRFHVEETSVRAYLATPQFHVRDGHVSIASPSQITYRDFEDVIDGHDEGGCPFWSFSVAARYFDGFSLMGFPPELARELGCGPNEGVLAPIVEPEHCGTLSVNWRLSSFSGASVGQLSRPLGKLGVSDGDRVLLVLLGDGVALRKESIGAEGVTEADALLEQLKRRRKVL